MVAGMAVLIYICILGLTDMTPVFQTGGAGSTPAGCLKIGKLCV